MPEVREHRDWAWCCHWSQCGGIGVPGVVTTDGRELCAACLAAEPAPAPEPAGAK